ncbi:MAG: alpha/beta hydrolase [Gemmataceae bacterium]
MVRRILSSIAVLLLFSGLSFGQSPSPKEILAKARVEKDLVYGPHERNKLDLAVPQGDGPFPLIVWIHGGGWEMGSKAGFGPLIEQIPRGYALASIAYRFSQHAVFPAQLLDAKDAIRYLRENAKKYNIDPDRIAVSGASAGGHLAALVGTSNGVKELDAEGAKAEATRVVCVVDFFGPTNLPKLSPPGSESNPVTKLLGGDTGVKKELAKLASPMTHIDAKDPPFLIIQGDSDRVVPFEQSEELHDALKKAGVESDLFTVKGGGHGLGIFNKATSEKVSQFLDSHLKKQAKP